MYCEYLSHLSFNDIEYRGETHASLLRHHEAFTSDGISVAVGRHGHTDELGTDLLPADRKCLITEEEHVGVAGRGFLPQVLWSPPGQSRPVAESIPDDARLVWSNPVSIELQRVRWPLQVRHGLVQIQI